jgi:hypothetical protein
MLWRRISNISFVVEKFNFFKCVKGFLMKINLESLWVCGMFYLIEFKNMF